MSRFNQSKNVVALVRCGHLAPVVCQILYAFVSLFCVGMVGWFSCSFVWPKCDLCNTFGCLGFWHSQQCAWHNHYVETCCLVEILSIIIPSFLILLFFQYIFANLSFLSAKYWSLSIHKASKIGKKEIEYWIARFCVLNGSLVVKGTFVFSCLHQQQLCMNSIQG